MTLAVGVHGIGQQRVSSRRLADRWHRALVQGMRPATAADLSFELAYYAHLFPGRSGRLGDGGPADPTETVPSEGELLFIEEVLSDLSEDLPEEELALAATGELGPPALWPAFVNRALLTVDRRWGRTAGSVLLRCVRQVYWYLSRPALAEEIRRVVADTVAERGRVVVIGHSLGSVIVYDALTRGSLPTATVLVTIGSPLSWPTIRRRLDGGDPPVGCTWTNLFDPLDVVTGGHGLAPSQPGVVDCRVSNGLTDPHAAVRYLRQREIVAAVSPSPGPRW